VDIGEAWRTSRVSYTELVYRPILRSGYSSRDMGSRKSVQRALTGATVNKLIFAFFTMAGALFPFALYRLRITSASVHLASAPIDLTVAASLSLLLVFGYLVLYCVQVLPSFVSSGSFGPLAQLPVASRDVSTVAAMTLWRTLDYILLASLASQLAATAYFTGSVAGTLLVALASVSSSLLAIGLALWLTSVFQRRLEGGSLSGVRAFFRPLYFVLWGLGVMSAVFLFSAISFVAPPLQAALTHPSSPEGFVLSLVLPFSAGLIVSHFSGQNVAALSLVLAVGGMAIAALGSLGASAVIFRTIAGVVLPTRGVTGEGGRTELSFRVRGPLSAYILKDIRVSSRNPATGFLFALPLFEIIAVVIPLTATPLVRMAPILVGAQVGGGFALFVAFLLVTVEDLGVERRTALPFSESIRTLSKVIVSTAAYVPVPVALTLVLLGKAMTFEDGAIIIPIATAVSVFAACVFEVSVLKALADAGRGTAVRFAAGVGSGELVLILPTLAYAVAYILWHDHVAALESFALVTTIELAAGAFLLRLKAVR
jgi:predicted permease